MTDHTTFPARHGFLIDMDGVLYRGAELLPGAGQFVRELRARGVPFRFLTNNSQRTRRDVVAKLARMGIEVEEEHVFTSAMATARFVARQKPGGTAFVIGEGGLLQALHKNGYASWMTIRIMSWWGRVGHSTWKSSRLPCG